MTFRAGNRFRPEAADPRSTPSVSQISRGTLPAAVFGLALALGAPAAAQAGLQPPTYGAEVRGVREGEHAGPFGANNSNYAVPAYESQVGTNWGVSASADDTAGGTVTASALVTLNPLQQTQVSSVSARSTLSYWFTIVGPDPDALVPVLFNAAGSTSYTEGGYGSVFLGFDGQRWETGVHFGPGSSGFAVHDLFYLVPDQIYGIEMIAEASANFHYGVTTDGIAQASATVDPTFQILGAYAGLYHFVGLPASAIVTDPTSAVPEPASWAMMVGGFGLIGSAMRRRRLRALAA
jgi:hypothetical protein